MTRVLIADDQPLMRTGFRMILDAEPDLEVVGEAADGEEAIRLAARVRADVVLMDVRMPRLDGIEATRRLAGPGVEDPVRVLILTTFDLDEYVLSALRAGASGFLLKDAPPEDLVEAIRIVAAGNALIAPSVTRRLLDRFATSLPDPAAARPAALDSLTAREVEVLGLVARGMSNAEIAERLYVSETTVKTHVGRILAKLDLRDRVQAVVLAYETIPGWSTSANRPLEGMKKAQSRRRAALSLQGSLPPDHHEDSTQGATEMQEQTMELTVELTTAEAAKRLEELALAGSYHKLTPDHRALLRAIAAALRKMPGAFVKAANTEDRPNPTL